MSVDPDLPVAGAPASHLVGVAAVGLGGAVGALARAGLVEVSPHSPGEWPWSTLVTNASGSALLGALLVVLARRFPRDRYARPLLGTGLLGGYTTFSTFSVDAVQLVRFDRPGVAFAYVGASLVTILLGCLSGLAVARRIGARPEDSR